MAMTTASDRPRSADNPQPSYNGVAGDADTEQNRDTPYEPRALRDWEWREDADASRNPCHRTDGRGGSAYLKIRTGDLVWTGERPGTPPGNRTDGIPWRYGLNLRTARTGWFPCTYVTKPAARFRHQIRNASSDSVRAQDAEHRK